jgi:hypothetical protein
VEEARPYGFDPGGDLWWLVAGQVVRDDGVAGPDCGDVLLLRLRPLGAQLHALSQRPLSRATRPVRRADPRRQLRVELSQQKLDHRMAGFDQTAASGSIFSSGTAARIFFGAAARCW